MRAASVSSGRITTSGFLSVKVQYLIMAAVAIVFYGNTIFNEYALDDGLVIHENPFTQAGFEGIDDLLTHDAFYGYYQKFGSAGELEGGRYRPLSLITFAIEWELFGEAPGISHAVNVLLYLLTLLVLLNLLHRYLLPNKPLFAFFTVLIFAIHPIHTEVVANIKSRDEILVWLLLLLTIQYIFKHREKLQLPQLAIAGGLFFLALLAKENAVTFLAIIPLTLYFFSRFSIHKIVVSSLPLLFAFILYFFLRIAAVGFGTGGAADEVMNNPFLFASASEALATKIYILLLYLKLLVLPWPLSFDYSYNQIAYRTFGDIEVWLSLAIHGGLLLFSLFNLKNRHPLAYAILFYLITLSIVSNFVVDIGATMGERLIYISSFGFALAIGFLFQQGYNWLSRNQGKVAQPLMLGVAAALTFIAAFFVIQRNADWENNTTLYLADVETVPNSLKAQTAAATAYIGLAERETDSLQRTQHLLQALEHLQQAKQIHPDFADIYLNEGTAYYWLGNYEQAEAAWNEAEQRFPNHPTLRQNRLALSQIYFTEGLRAGEKQDYQKAVTLLEKAARYDPGNAEKWYNLAGAQFSIGQYEQAKTAFEKTLALQPNHAQARQGFNAVQQIIRQNQ